MDVREQLIDAGVELLERDGLAELTQRRIAVRAGVSHGAPRHHFPAYANLLAAIARRGVDDLDALIREALGRPDPREALHLVSRSVVDFAVRRPAMFELIARHDLLAGAGGDLRPVTTAWVTLLTDRIREVRPGAGPEHTVALWAGVQGLGVMLGRRSAEVLIEDSVEPDDVFDVLLAGVLGDEGRGRPHARV